LGSFLYYFPDRADTISRNHFNEADKKCGLDSILRDASLASNGPPSGGPGGSNGVLAMIVTNTWGGERLQYNPDTQIWMEVNPHYSIGYYKDERPTAIDLVRPKTIPGELVDLNGEQWLVPVCGPRNSKLPHAFKFNGQGEWISEVKSEYAYLMADSEQALKDMQSANDKNYQEVFSRHMDFCTRMLGVNYHVGRHEVTILEALTTETFMLILRAAIGRLTFEREQEKQSAAADTIT
jgi:hypothetical protein